MSYSLANLEDGEYPNTRDELLDRIMEFFSLTTGINEQDDHSADNVHLYPNPASNLVTLVINLNKDASMKVEVFNLMGQRVLSEAEKMYPAGRNEIHLNTNHLNPGAYVCHVNLTANSFSGKLLIVR